MGGSGPLPNYYQWVDDLPGRLRAPARIDQMVSSVALAQEVTIQR
jgi:hypothetical protein